jgi:hypothetical protein
VNEIGQYGEYMRKRLLIFVSLVTTVLMVSLGVIVFLKQPNQTARSPYIEQLDSSVRGLSAQEVDDLLNGRGAGYARTAELNNYPGPRHVLDLKQELGLSADQVQQIQAAFEQMQAKAKQVGQEIIQYEARFSAAFANRTISETDLQEQTKALALLYGQLRAIHLEAHLKITPLLSIEQITTYNILRGYTGASGRRASDQHPHQNH